MTVFIKKDHTFIPKMLPLKCDYLSVTVDIPKGKDQDWLAHNIKNSPIKTWPFGNYQVATKIPGTEYLLSAPGADKTWESSVLLQCKPKPAFSNCRFLRVEFNPSRVDLPLVACLIDNMLPDSGLYDRVMHSGSVTRIDLALDVAHAPIDDLLFFASGFSISRVDQKSGRTEYIGADRWRIYNKQAQIEASNKKKAIPAHLKVPGYPLTRFELELKPKMSLPKICSLGNEFSKLYVSSYSHLPEGDVLWDLFIIGARHEGAQAALMKVKKKNLRKQLKARLDEGRTAWWNSDEVWGQLPNLVDSILHPFDDESAASVKAA